MTHPELVAAISKPGIDIWTQLTPTDAELWHMATGISTEAGELLDAVKKAVIYRKALDLENVMEELGDLEFFMERLRQLTGITRDATIKANLSKLTIRYSDIKYSNQAAQDRKDKQEA